MAEDARISSRAPTGISKPPGVKLVLAFLFAIIVVASGLRWSGLNTKMFWGDEAATALRISGHTQAELDQLADAKIHPFTALQRFQSVDSETSLVSTANSLAVDEPQHPPLFFVADRLWATLFGSSTAALRSLSAATGMLAVPAMYWLCLELFGAVTFALVGASLIAVSPFFVTYAHEAREYAPWGTITICATAALLATQRSRWWWLLYAVLTAAGLYLDILYVWVIAAHAIVIATREPRRRVALIGFAAAVGAAFVVFEPWIVTFIQHRYVIAYGLNWGSAAMNGVTYLEKIAFAISTPLFDLAFENYRWAPLAASACALIAVAFAVVARTARPTARTVIFALSFISFFAFLLEDAFTHSYYATGSRYLVASWVGVELALTYFIVRLSERRRAIAGAIFVIVLVLGCICDLKADRTTVWWDNHDDFEMPAIARAVDSDPQPLVVVEHARLTKLLVISHMLNGGARFALLPIKPGAPSSVTIGNSPAFLLEPSRSWLTRTARAGCRVIRAPVHAESETAADRSHAQLLVEQGRDAPTLWRIVPSASCTLLPA